MGNKFEGKSKWNYFKGYKSTYEQPMNKLVSFAMFAFTRKPVKSHSLKKTFGKPIDLFAWV